MSPFGLLLPLALTALPSCAESSSPTEALLDGEFELVASVDAAPPPVRRFLESKLVGGIAPVDGDFNPGDVVSPASPPPRRIILAGLSEMSFLLLYEHGGRGLHHHLVRFERSETDWTPVFAARPQLLEAPRSIQALREALASQPIPNELESADEW